MRTYFAEVLARESARLAEVRDGATLESWRHHLVAEVMTPRSRYVSALRQSDDETSDRAEFLDQWRELLIQMIERVQRSRASDDVDNSARHSPTEDIDTEKTAVLILAALHGGVILTQLARDPQPLNAALDLALVPLMTAAGNGVAKMGPNRPVSNMDV